MPAHPRQDGWIALLLAIVAGAVFLWPVVPGAAAIVADPLGEGDNHLWMLWRAARGGGPVANLPLGVDIPLMDPANLPPYAVGALVGPAAGWAALRAWNVGLALAGGWRLSRCFVSGPAAWVGMVALGTAPFLAGVMDFGITESWPLGWMALHLALLVEQAREGGARKALLAGLCLGMVALSGWYHAFFALVVEVPLAAALLWRHRRGGTLAQGGVALAMVLPSFLRFQATLGSWEHRWRAPSPGPPGPREDWADLPVYGTDLLNLVLPHPGAVHPAKSVYLGVVLLVLVGVALVRRPRVAGPLVALALPLLALALGTWPTLAGKALGFKGLPWLLFLVSDRLQALSHWQRAVGLALPLLAAAAAVGVDALGAGRRWAAALGLLVLVDGVVLGGTAWPRSVTGLAPPAVLRELPAPGAVVQIPFDNGRKAFAETPARDYQRWQVAHGRGIAENYEGVDALLASSTLVGALDAACWVQTTLPPYYQPPPEMRDPTPPVGAELVRQRRALVDAGFRYVVLHRTRCRTPAKLIQRADALLGPGERRADGDVVWDLEMARD